MHKKTAISHYKILSLCLAVIVMLNGALWFSVRHTQAQWGNVPPVPSHFSATLPALGDKQYAYRLLATFMQNLGDSGGRTTSLKDYNYERLGDWFMLGHSLDPYSNTLPSLAGYVFGGSQNPALLAPIVDYLEVAGAVMKPQKWRWWMQAIFLARHKMEDMERALNIADKLANRDEEGLPAFTRQMKAFILNNQGEKEAALTLMINLLKSEGENLHPAEVNAIKFYICEQILSDVERKTHELCEQVP